MGADSCASRPMKQRSVKALSDGNTQPKSPSSPGDLPVDQKLLTVAAALGTARASTSFVETTACFSSK